MTVMLPLPIGQLFAKSVRADAFISLHMNSATSKSANGTEVYYSVSNNKTSFSGITSKAMAKFVPYSIISRFKNNKPWYKNSCLLCIKTQYSPGYFD